MQRLPVALLTPLAALALTATPARGQGPDYLVYVASEAVDQVALVRWSPRTGQATVDRRLSVGLNPVDLDGPHGVALSPDGKFLYVTTAHGTPYGSLWKMSAGSDTLLGRAQVEMFPTTIALTPDGALAFVANSDFHGDHPRMNVVSIVQTATMTPLTNLPACDMPHGVKSNHAGSFVYVSCMNSDEILEIDRQSLRIRRRHKTGEGMPAGHAMSAKPPIMESLTT